MSSIQVVIKRSDREAIIDRIEPELRLFQKIVEGHTKSLFIGREASNRIVIVCNDDRDGLAFNLSLEDGRAIHGTCFVTKVDAHGTNVSLTDAEAEDWRGFFGIANVKRMESAQPTIEPNDSMQIMLVPRMVDADTEDELEAEEILARLMEQFDREWETLPIKTHGSIYDLALEALKSQELDFEIVNAETMLLKLTAEGEDEAGEKFLRVIRFKSDDDPIIIADKRGLANFYGVPLDDDSWERRLLASISDSTQNGCRVTFDDEGIELAPMHGALPGLPLAFPFTDADWRSLLSAYDAGPVTH